MLPLPAVWWLANIDGSGDYISYLIYPDANYQDLYSVGQNINFNSLNLLSLILISTNADFPLYIKISSGTNVRVGTYTDTIYLVWNYIISVVLAYSDYSLGWTRC